jgi:pimeloyl-ACP methyl ester carboxylesterase
MASQADVPSDGISRLLSIAGKLATMGAQINVAQGAISMSISVARRLLLIAGLLFAGASTAQEVTLPYRGLTLNGKLELAAGKTLADGVVLITHGTIAHGGMEAMAYLQQLFKDKGRNTLAINLGLGLDNRHGMYECATPHRHRHEDALDEIGAWLEWLKGKGARKVVLMGHSRGGNQTAWYAAERDSALVTAVVLYAPATWDADKEAQGYEKRYKKPLKPVLDKAETLVKAGKGSTLLEHTDFLYCPDTSVSAESFVSYYRNDSRRDTPTLLPRIKKPVLVVVAGNDEVVTDLQQKVPAHVDGKRVQMKVVDGADHFFRDLFADDAVDAIEAFLASK